ncbi:MAG: type I methionyl aminopeptidase [Candidatus Shapirobacteria bacterium]|jgi:methionyl aminopeptidase
MVIIKTPGQIIGIRLSSRLAAETLNYLADFLKPGITTGELNTLAHDFILSKGAIPAPLNYNGFPKSICTSVNNVVCHGIPSDTTVLKNGDLINLDITTILNGFYGDVSASYPIGRVSPLATKLLQVTRQSLDLAIKCLKPGRYLNDCIGKIIEPFVKKHGFSVVRDLGGHGIGLNFHEDPFVFHFDTHKNDVILKPGMVFTIEPMVNASPEWRITVDKNDGWTIRTADGSLSCQFEHTILITPNGSEVLTKL